MTEQNNAAIEPSAFEPLDGSVKQGPVKRNPLRWVMAGTAALFLLVMLFLFSARSVEVIVTAQAPAEIGVSGLALPFGDRYLLLPGKHTVNASAQGYHALTTEVEVTDADSQQVELVLLPLPGLLSIDTTPAEAEVFLNNESLGHTPLKKVSVEAGQYQLRLVAERYLPQEQPLVITGRKMQQNLALELAPAWADVSLSSTPE